MSNHLKHSGEDVLIFASKLVGYKTVEFLLKSKSNIGRIIVANDSDTYNKKIVQLAKMKGIDFEIFSKTTQDSLITSKKKYTWLLNLWSPFILSKKVLDLARYRLNIHSGLVPLCRGNDNAAWCIRKSLKAGVALLEMNKGVDSGSIYVQKEIPYSFPTTGKHLHKKLQQTAIKLFIKKWPQIYKRNILPQKQRGRGNYFTREDTQKDRIRDGSVKMSLHEFMTWTLAHDFYPGTTAEIRYNNTAYTIQLRIKKKTKSK